MECKICNKQLTKTQIKRGNTLCSHKCRNIFTGIIFKTNHPLKGKTFSKEWREKIGRANAVALKGKHCSPNTEFKKGQLKPINGYVFPKKEKNPNWHGGVPRSVRQRIMETLEYKKWRRNVFIRDKYTCAICQSTGRHLHADHIIPFVILLKKQDWKTLWDINNGRTLCEECHKSTDTYGLKVYKFIEQYDQKNR